ncbi:MAG: YcfA family protein, partial [uncultured bacterium]
YSGGRHQFMLRGDLALTLPNPHRGDIGKDLLLRILKQAEMTREEFEAL